MNAPADLLTDPSAAPGHAERDAAYVDRQLAVLARLAEAGLEIAVALEAQVKGGPAVVDGDVAMAYNRVARAVRHTLMLQARLIEARREGRRAEAGRQASVRSSAARVLRGAIADSDDHERIERLTAEAAERLRAEHFGDLLARPFGEAVAAICKDLGLSPDWLKLAQDCAEAEAALDGKAQAAEKEDDIWRGPVEVQWLRDIRKSADSS